MKPIDSMQDEITRGKRVVLSKRERLDRWNDQETREELREVWEKQESKQKCHYASSFGFAPIKQEGYIYSDDVISEPITQV